MLMGIFQGLILRVGTIYKEGSIVRLMSPNGSAWSIIARPLETGGGDLTEYPSWVVAKALQENKNTKSLCNFEGKVGLIVKVIRNRLDQPMGYRVLIGKETWFCKSIVAEKYFNLMEKKGDESR